MRKEGVSVVMRSVPYAAERGASKGILVTTSGYGRAAFELAGGNRSNFTMEASPGIYWSNQIKPIEPPDPLSMRSAVIWCNVCWLRARHNRGRQKHGVGRPLNVSGVANRFGFRNA